MKVYVESNFVLELVLEQEESSACDELVGLAEKGKITLVMPALSLFEPFTTLIRRQKEWKSFQSQVTSELKQIVRMKSLQSEVDNLSALLVKATDESQARFEEVVARLLAAATILPLSASVFRDAHDYGVDLSLPDALMLASVLGDRSSPEEPSCFLNRNTKDFLDKTDVRKLLSDRQCKLIGSFAKGLAYVRSQPPSVSDEPS